jgi:hypothetical protein
VQEEASKFAADGAFAGSTLVLYYSRFCGLISRGLEFGLERGKAESDTRAREGILSLE